MAQVVTHVLTPKNVHSFPLPPSLAQVTTVQGQELRRQLLEGGKCRATGGTRALAGFPASLPLNRDQGWCWEGQGPFKTRAFAKQKPNRGWEGVKLARVPSGLEGGPSYLEPFLLQSDDPPKSLYLLSPLPSTLSYSLLHILPDHILPRGPSLPEAGSATPPLCSHSSL